MKRTGAGFTLVEMLAVLAIIGLMMSLGTPVYLRWIAGNEVSNAARTLTQEISRVRTQVKHLDAPITLTVTNGSSSVSDTNEHPSIRAGSKQVQQRKQFT